MTRSFALCIFALISLISGLPAEADQKQEQRVPFNFLDIGSCSFGHCATKHLVAPAGSRIVIETFSMAISVAEGETVGSVGLRQASDDGGTTLFHLAPPAAIAQIPNVTGVVDFIVSQTVRLYPDPEFDVIILGETTQDGAGFVATISGYFLPLKSRTLSP